MLIIRVCGLRSSCEQVTCCWRVVWSGSQERPLPGRVSASECAQSSEGECRSAGGRHPGATWLRCGTGGRYRSENEMRRDASARTFRRKTWQDPMGGWLRELEEGSSGERQGLSGFSLRSLMDVGTFHRARAPQKV